MASRISLAESLLRVAGALYSGSLSTLRVWGDPEAPSSRCCGQVEAGVPGEGSINRPGGGSLRRRPEVVEPPLGAASVWARAGSMTTKRRAELAAPTAQVGVIPRFSAADLSEALHSAPMAKNDHHFRRDAPHFVVRT